MSKTIKLRAIDLENLGVDLRFVHGDYSEEERQAIKHQARLIAAAPELLEALLEAWPYVPDNGGTCTRRGCKAECQGSRLAAETRAIPAPWREAVKVARKKLDTMKLALRVGMPMYGADDQDEILEEAIAAPAQLDALEGGE